MELQFTRTGERSYVTIARREDGVTLRVPSVDRPTWIPHDLAHYVVEDACGFTWGFWGCVAAGAIFPGMSVIGGRQPPHAAARSQALLHAIGQRGTEVEVLVGILVGITQEGLDPHSRAAQARVADAWRNPTHMALPAVPLATAAQICTALHAAHEQWNACAIGQPITVAWRQQLPRSGPVKNHRRQLW